MAFQILLEDSQFTDGSDSTNAPKFVKIGPLLGTISDKTCLLNNQ